MSDNHACCCTIQAGQEGVTVCPTCGNQGKPVAPETLRALLQPSLQSHVQDAAYRFCASSTCPVVYFLPGTSQTFIREQLTVRVGVKETSAPRPLCYCFGHSEESLREEWLRKGKSTAVAAIQAAVKAGTCRCQVTNPQGNCCLGDVVQALQAIHAFSRSSGKQSKKT
jgi:hypothetical protein